jgi:16S rRNA (uracil1498-N3)-methyltransferase
MATPIANTHRFFVDATTFTAGTTTDANLVHQWSRVLRLRVDQHLMLLDGLGQAAVVRISELTPKQARWQVVDSFVATGEPRLQVTLAVSLIRAERFEWLLQKATEIGVGAIVPIIAERSVSDGDVSPTKRERWQRIIREAAEQSCRGILPQLAPAVALTDMRVPDAAQVYWCHEGPGTRPLRQLPCDASRPVWLISGPEGSFSPNELTWLTRQSTWYPAGLGTRILRAETAPLVAATILLTQAGDFDGEG